MGLHCAPECRVALQSAAVVRDPRAVLIHADAVRLAAVPPESVDAMVCDPPAGVAFMGKEWDRPGGASGLRDTRSGAEVPEGAPPFARSTVRYGDSAGYGNASPRAAFIASLRPIFAAAFAALKPGAHGLVWTLPRTAHWTATALEDAGFEIRDSIAHFFGSGFPKSLNVSKQTEKECSCGQAEGRSGLSKLRAIVSSQESDRVEQGETLLSALLWRLLQARSPEDRPAETDRFAWEGRVDGEKPGFVYSEDDGGEESGMAGRRDGAVPRQLSRGSVRSLPGGVLGDGQGRWLRDGAPASHGEVARALLAALRGGSPQGPRSLEQLASEFAVVLNQLRAQACGSCRAAARWAGWGTALKPGREDWILVRKPLNGTVAQNVQEHGTGALNVDGCRIRRDPGDVSGWSQSGSHASPNRSMSGSNTERAPRPDREGRWPANVILSHGPDCVRVGERAVPANGSTTGAEPSAADIHGNPFGRVPWDAHGNGDGTETVEVYQCAPGCPVAELDAQSGVSVSTGGGCKDFRKAPLFGHSGGNSNSGGPVGYGDVGGASRYFKVFPPERGVCRTCGRNAPYTDWTECERCMAERIAAEVAGGDQPAGPDGPGFLYAAKPSRRERDAGCDHLPVRTGGEATEREDGSAGLDSPRAGAGRRGGARNHHPTVKSIALMRYLCRLITPPGGVVLDPFTGSGSTAVAAIAEGFRFFGFEREAEYAEIAKARIGHALKGTP